MPERLAIDGGPKVNTEKFPMWPSFCKKSIEAAQKPLKTGRVNYWTGEKGMQFEAEFAKWCGARFCISTANGTSALHVALAGQRIGPGDEVICPSYSFIASSFCICQAGGVPVFADVEKASHTIDPRDVEDKITDRTRGIIAVHLYGIMSDMAPLLKIARKHNLVVIEDCAQAHGALYRGKKAGTVGHIGAFSFCQSKHFTTGGEGGAVVTDDEEVAWRCRSFRDHGYDVKERLRLLDLEAKLPYIHTMVGFNYRMTEMQSAIGIHELARMDRWNLPNRRRNAEYLTRNIRDLPEILHLPLDTAERRNSYWLYPIIVDIERFKGNITELWHAIEAEGVPVGPVLWPQMYKEVAYREHHGFGRLDYPFKDPNTRPAAVDYRNVHCHNAAWVEERTFFIPVHPVYQIKHMRLVVKAIRKVFAALRK